MRENKVLTLIYSPRMFGGDQLRKKKESPKLWHVLGLMTNIGITLAASVFIGYYMGHYLDRWLFHKTGYIMTMVFSLFGVGAGFSAVFKMINKTLDKDEGNGGNKE
ncbi:MAG: AtpZ/AtpI family protein [Syntrophaceticus schinkii]|jgi:F0F1-type ATP synthase assembly protein I